jgi:hypothetical protein
MLTTRAYAGVAVINDTFYVVGGRWRTYIYIVEPTSANEQYIPFGYDVEPPSLHILSPVENMTYTASNVSLSFTVSEPASWMGYSLDGQDNVTINGNTTMTGLAEGSHRLTVYARDKSGKTRASETIYFSIKIRETDAHQFEPFPTPWVVAAAAIIATGGVAVTFGVVTHRRKRSAPGKTP